MWQDLISCMAPARKCLAPKMTSERLLWRVACAEGALMCYHGSVTKHEAERLLSEVNTSGAYLIRDSDTVAGTYVLCLWLSPFLSYPFPSLPFPLFLPLSFPFPSFIHSLSLHFTICVFTIPSLNFLLQAVLQLVAFTTFCNSRTILPISTSTDPCPL